MPSSPRDLSYLASLSGPSLRQWAATLSVTVREMVLWRARGYCAAAREADDRRKSMDLAEAKSAASSGALHHLQRKRMTAASVAGARGGGGVKGQGPGGSGGGPGVSRGSGVAVPGVTNRSVKGKFAKDMAPVR